VPLRAPHAIVVSKAFEEENKMPYRHPGTNSCDALTCAHINWLAAKRLSHKGNSGIINTIARGNSGLKLLLNR
jgi:hypothetical protein